LAAVSPLYRMPDPVTRRREAAIAEVRDALAAARCAARLADLVSPELVVRELLLNVIDQTARAEESVAALISTPSRDVVP
jgi:hypothetical protein